MDNSNIELYQKTKDKIKSYWNRPGGKVGTVVFYILLAFLGYKFTTAILPKITEMMDDTTDFLWGLSKFTVVAAGTAFIVGGLLYALSSARFRAGIVALWEKIFINSWLQLFIKVDPEKIAKGRIEEFEEERENFSKKSEEIAGSLAGVNKDLNDIDNKVRNIDKQIAVVKSVEQAGVLAREKGYAIEWKNKLIPLKNGLEKTLQAVDKIYENSGYALQDMKNQYEYTVKMFRSTNQAAGALKSALAMFSGNGAKSQLGAEAMLYMDNQISLNIGSMRQDMKSIDKFVGSIDLQNQVYDAEGLEEIKNLNPELYKKFQGQIAAQNQAQVYPIPTNGSINLPTTVKVDDKRSFLDL